MVVRCVKTSIDTDNSNVINSDMREYLKIGNEYIVYGIRTSNESSYFMIFDDGHLVEVPSSMFEVIEGKVSPLWVVWDDGLNNITLWPELFYKDDFFENFSEWEDRERKEFEKLKQYFEECKEPRNSRAFFVR
ncbi:MAG: hypothetical protein AAF600_21050 [Bacteroidota bacterium]